MTSALFATVIADRLAKQLRTALGGTYQETIVTKQAVVLNAKQIAVDGQRYALDSTSLGLAPGQTLLVKNVGRAASVTFVPAEPKGVYVVDGGTRAGAGSIGGAAASAGGGVGSVILGANTLGILKITAQQLTLLPQPAAYVWAGPPSGGATTPTFRRLTAADLPTALVVRVETDSYTETAGDSLIVCNKATSMTVTLLAATGSGRVRIIKNIGVGTVTVDGNSGDTIDGETTQELAQWDAVQIVDYAAGAWAVI